MGSHGPQYELIYHDSVVYEGLIDFKFTLMHKGILVITKVAQGMVNKVS